MSCSRVHFLGFPWDVLARVFIFQRIPSNIVARLLVSKDSLWMFWLACSFLRIPFKCISLRARFLGLSIMYVLVQTGTRMTMLQLRGFKL